MRKIIVFVALTSLSAVAAVTTVSKETEILAQAREYRLIFRQGNMQTVHPLIAHLEQAVAQYSKNVRIWNALGGAYFARLSASYVGHADPDKRLEYIEQARHAYARAMQIDPTDAEAVAGHGMAIASLGLLKQDARSLTAGANELNRAVRLDSTNLPARLMRAFTMVNLPPAVRDTPIVIEDLNYLVEEVPGSRAEAMLHLLLGDVYAETGQLAAAGREYALVSRAYRFPAEQAQARVQALEQSEGIPPADIGRVRGALTFECAACHGRGTDQ
jgi:tetratricopeptide (TPR) repeat protein